MNLQVSNRVCCSSHDAHMEGLSEAAASKGMQYMLKVLNRPLLLVGDDACCRATCEQLDTCGMP